MYRIDEAHNVAARGSSKSDRAKLAELLASRSDALIMTSATPHDGKPASFASLMNMLNPTAIANPEEYLPEDIKGLYLRRFKKDIREQIKGSFHERIVYKLATKASVAEEHAFDVLSQSKFESFDRQSRSRTGQLLFRTVLEKALFSSPAACRKTIAERLKKLDQSVTGETDRATLLRLDDALCQIQPSDFSKYQALLAALRPDGELKWNPADPHDRLVLFTERIETLRFLYEQLKHDLGLKKDQISILHGSSQDDIDLQEIVKDFGTGNSPIRLLIASDIASEGINLHFHSHKLVHFDIPWSLMTFQQRNGRVDRYGQEKQPVIAYLTTIPAHERIRGDLRNIELLIEKDTQAQKNIGDPSVFLGVYDEREEELITARAIEAYFIDNDEVPFGYEFFRRLTLREVNFGEKGPSNGQMRIAGRPWADRPFRFCSGCGKIRKKQNEKLEHARYCTFYGKEERTVEESASFLYRELTSEAIRMLLPVATTEVEKNLNSFVAALDLGLRKKFRGDPGHLLSTTYDEPIEGSDARKRFLVLYDGVPGGTGYLKELMQQPDTLFEVFQFAHDVLATCPCQHDPTKDGCYRCLLAYHGRHDRLNTSRTAALRLLTLILEHRNDLKQTDRLNSIRMNRLIESELEARFIEALRLPRPGESEWQLSTQMVNGKQGFYLKTNGGNYRIEPQVSLGAEQNVSRSSIADFVFYPERPVPGELPIAVFTDGFEYHADAANLRVGSDLAQRMAIARSGRFHVWSLTWDDVDAVGKDRREPAFAEGQSALELLRKLDEINAPTWAEMYGRTAFDWLLFRLGTGRALDWGLHARAWLASQMNAHPWAEDTLRELRDLLLQPGDSFVVPDIAGTHRSTSFRAAVVRNSSIGYIIRGDLRDMRPPDLNGLTATFRLFDEAATGERITWKRDWRSFLQWFNTLQFAGPLDFVSSSGLRDGVYGAMLIDDLALEQPRESVALVDASLHPLLNDLQAAGILLPTSGFELAADDGEIVATAELAWEGLSTAILMEHEWDGRSEFEGRGWKIYQAASLIDSSAELLAALPGAES
jgi:hypothetical protein